MPKELRISVTVPVPDDMFEAADKLHEIKPLIEHMSQAVTKLGGSMSHEMVTPRVKANGE